MTVTKRAAAYVRVSSEEQTDGWSMEGQEQQIREYAERTAYEIVQVYQDELSGSKDKRPGFERMMLDAHTGLFSAIIVLHTSRLFRNVALSRRYKDELRNKLNVEVLFVNQPVSDDPTGFMMETLNEMFDEYYLYQLRMWTTLGKQTRAQKGLYNGTLPFGYGPGEEGGVPVEHPTNAEGLRMAFRSYSTGRYSDREIAELLNQEGYRTSGNWGERVFTKDTVNRMLRNVFYLGHVKYKGELIPGQHPALIDQELFDKCQEVRASRRNRARSIGETRRVYVLSGIARCKDCGLTLRCYATKSKGKWRYMRHTAKVRGYDCVVGNAALRADKLEGQLATIISRIKLPLDWRQRIEELAGDTDQRETILKERSVIQEKLRRIKRLYRDLLMDEDEYRSTHETLQARLDTLVLPNSPHLVRAAEYLGNLKSLWTHATLAEQRDITRMMLKSVNVDLLGQRIVSIEPQPVFRLLFTEVCGDLGITII